jgi:zinc carboxypeptidase
MNSCAGPKGRFFMVTREAIGWIGLWLALMTATTVFAQNKPRTDFAFDRYHDSRETEAWLRQLARQHPDLVKVESLGKSGQGKDLLLAVVTDTTAGRPEQKPGVYVEGNLHGNERIGGEAALFLIHQLVTERHKDPALEDLLRTRTFWVVPRANPDAADVWVRGILKPDDEDNDGKEDEDGPEDVDGNGRITSMRLEEPEGPFIPDPKDGRLMVFYASLTVKERKRYRGLRYRVLREGIDNDGDGEVNEDGPDWEIDPNRDFPADLKMERKYRKKYARGGATRTGGRPPKVSRGKKETESEFARCPEVKAYVQFLASHPSIALAISFHSYGNALFRPFGYIPDRPTVPREDLRLLDEIGKTFARITGFKGYGPPYLGERQVVGGLHDYTYWDLGYPGFTVEIWSVPGVGRDWADRGQRRDRASRNRNRQRGPRQYDSMRNHMLAYIDREKVADGFTEWTRFDHPTLGPVEIGGLWDPRRFQYNPPPSRIRGELAPFVRFALEAARTTPLVRIVRLDARTSRTRVRAVHVEVMNIGGAPTAWQLAVKRGLARPTQVTLELPDGVRLSSGRVTRDLGVLEAGKSVGLQWNVVVPGTGSEGQDVEVAVVVTSPTGGVHRKTVKLE